VGFPHAAFCAQIPIYRPGCPGRQFVPGAAIFKKSMLGIVSSSNSSLALCLLLHNLQKKCHSERGAPRSESTILMIAGGNHTLIYAPKVRSRRILAAIVVRRSLGSLSLARDDTLRE